MKKAVVLLSGGLDSATTLAVARAEGYEPHALSFYYGQRHACEIEAARRVARDLGVIDHRIMEIDLRSWGGSALTDDIDVAEEGCSYVYRWRPPQRKVFYELATVFDA